MKNFLFLGFVFATLCGIAHAEDNKGGLFIEPSLTYEQGDSEIDYPNPLGKSDGDINGFGVGMRLGFHVYESLFLGADGRYSMPTFKDSSLDQSVKSTAYNYGPVIGVQMPTNLGIRVWGTYIMGGQLDPEKDEGVDQKFEDGTGYRVGTGIKLGMVSLNLEYQFIKYDKTKIEEAGPFNNINFNDLELENQSWILSVSFPISL